MPWLVLVPGGSPGQVQSSHVTKRAEFDTQPFQHGEESCFTRYSHSF